MALMLSGILLAGDADSEAGLLVKPQPPLRLTPKLEAELVALGRTTISLPPMIGWLFVAEGSPGTHAVATRIVYPDGEGTDIRSMTLTWDEDVSYLSIRIRINEVTVPFIQEGIYRFKFLFDGSPLGELLLPIYRAK